MSETYPEFYFSTTCHVCKVKSQELKCCAKCKVYRYCSQDHQIVDWPRHKVICNILHKFLKRSALENCFSLTDNGWLFSKMKIKMLLENELNRPLTPAENQLWMFPRACAVCHETNIQGLFDCPSCPAASYCSTQHQISHQHKHNKVCKQMQLQYMIYCKRMNGEDDKSICHKLYNTLEEAADVFIHDCNEITDEALSMVQQGDKLSHALTIFSALSLCNVINHNTSLLQNQTNNSLTIHIVGATYEWFNCDRYVVEHLAHWIKNLQVINFIFVGPELSCGNMEEWAECNDCIKRNIQVSYKYEQVLYSEYFYSDRYTSPDVVTVFNCGFHETENLEIDTWKESLPLLLVPNVPLLITSYTQYEAVKDFNRIMLFSSDTHSVSVYKKYERNIYHSPLPLRDWIKPDEVYYNNNYHSVLMKTDLHQ